MTPEQIALLQAENLRMREVLDVCICGCSSGVSVDTDPPIIVCKYRMDLLAPETQRLAKRIEVLEKIAAAMPNLECLCSAHDPDYWETDELAKALTELKALEDEK